jgi:hypothetical protein
VSVSPSTIAPPQHFLYFLPEPHGHGSFHPTLEGSRLGTLKKIAVGSDYDLRGLNSLRRFGTASPSNVTSCSTIVIP